MRRFLILVLPLIASLSVATGAAQAVVVDMNPAAHGQASVSYPTDLSSGDYYGLALIPGGANFLSAAGIPVVTSSAPCADPAAGSEPDILGAGSWPLNALVSPICWHSGAVMHGNEAFTLEWEGQAPHTYWSTTKNYVHNYLSDVASASGSLTSPYVDTTQYWDGTSVSDRAAYNALYGGGCDDNGTAKCQFGSTSGSGAGNPLPGSSDCPVSGDNIDGGNAGGGFVTIANDLCLTDADIRHEVTSLVDNDGLIAHTQAGYSPLVVVLTPPGVKVCLDGSGSLCSANGSPTPPPPQLASSSSGGTVPAGTYQVVSTYVLGSGETVPSASSSITVSGSTSSISVASPPPHNGAVSWNVYFTGPDGGTFAKQGNQAIGTGFTLSAAPTAGSQPPVNPLSFCSYHSTVVDPQSNQTVTYVVQAWTSFTSCDEPDVPTLPALPTPQQLETIAGQALVSPISQASMGAVVNPVFTGWFGLDGFEINDQNGCHPLGQGLDTFTFGNSGQSPYFIQREFNNAAVVDSDPNTYGGCLPDDNLVPTFVAPSAISLGDTVDLDGSDTATSLAIPNANYAWDFGDGTTGTGPSVEHTYGSAGTYTVKLTVTDRGGNVKSVTQQVQVLTKDGLPAPPPSTTPTTNPSGPGAGTPGSAFAVTLRLLPQALRAVVRHGISVQVNSSEPANGFAQVLISRAAAKRAHIKVGRHAVLVMVGIGTVSGIKDGVVQLTVRMKRSLAKKLGRLHHVKLIVRMSLVGSDGKHITVDVAGRY